MVWGAVTVVFLIIRLVPGDALQLFLGTQVEMTPEQMKELRRVFGLDRPVWEQYVEYLVRVAQGDLGVSLRTARSVREEIVSRLPVTAELAVLAVLLGVGLGVPAGVVAATSGKGWAAMMWSVMSLVGLSVPSFWLGTMLILGSSRLGVRALGTYVPPWEDPGRNLAAMLLPAVALAVGLAASLMRYVRASVVEVLGREYVRTARAKGLGAGAVLGRHVLRNALIPVVTVVGFQMGYLLGGAVVIEEVFGLPGMGRLVLSAVLQRDYPMLQGVVLVTAILFVVVNLLTDVLYGWIDPRSPPPRRAPRAVGPVGHWRPGLRRPPPRSSHPPRRRSHLPPPRAHNRAPPRRSGPTPPRPATLTARSSPPPRKTRGHRGKAALPSARQPGPRLEARPAPLPRPSRPPR